MRTDSSSDWVLICSRGQAKARLRSGLMKQAPAMRFDIGLGGQVQGYARGRLSELSVPGVSCPFLRLEVVVGGPAAALWFAQHVVNSESPGAVLVSVLSPSAVRASGIPPAISVPLPRALPRLAQAFEPAGACRLPTGASRLAGDVPVGLRIEGAPPR